MRWIGLCACLLVVVAGAVLVMRSHRETAPKPRATANPAAPPAAPTFKVAPLPDDATSKRITTLLRTDAAFGRDVAFLLAASLRERCVPVHAGELATMANRARLPVLAATSELTAREPDLDHPIYQAIQRIAAGAPCGHALDLAPTGLQLRLDPERYAVTFPDSYYQPALSVVPHEYGDQPLAARAAQECQSIAYAVLPLGRSGWQCTSLWADTRTRFIKACEQARSEAGQGAADAISPEIAARLTPVVAGMLDKLPEACR